MKTGSISVQHIDHMGSDLTVVNSARVSFDKHKEFLELDDIRLIQYLSKNNHWSPFAHPQVQLRVESPVPIRTQCYKSKVGFVENEVSRRYVSDEPTLFVPGEWRGKPEGSAKQGSSGAVDNQSDCFSWYFDVWERAAQYYEDMIEEGVSPEQARFILPQGAMVSWYWTGSLAAYARFYKQRTDPHAQQEIQELAKMVGEIIEPLFPYSWEALCGTST